MPKAIIEFNLETEEKEFKLATSAKDIMYVLFALDQELRANIKYAPDTTSDETITALENIRDKLYELMNENNINFNMID